MPNDVTPLKDVIQSFVGLAKIGGILFAAGMAWQLLKTLRENLVELKASHTTLTNLVSSHETRIALLEEKKPRRRK